MLERSWMVLASTCTLLACRTAPSEPAAETPPAIEAEPVVDEPPAPSEPPPSSGDTATAKPEPTLCHALCMQRNAPRAVGAEVIERECTDACQRPSEPGPECRDAARKARARVEAVAMQRRAPVVWRELGDTALHCGQFDGMFDALAKAGAEVKPAARDLAIAGVIASDPFFEYTCPAGPSALDDARSRPPAEQVDALVQACPLRGIEVGAPIHRDLPAATFLAVRMVTERWQALGIRNGDHEILLETLLLASALERK